MTHPSTMTHNLSSHDRCNQSEDLLNQSLRSQTRMVRPNDYDWEDEDENESD